MLCLITDHSSFALCYAGLSDSFRECHILLQLLRKHCSATWSSESPRHDSFPTAKSRFCWAWGLVCATYRWWGPSHLVCGLRLACSPWADHTLVLRLRASFPFQAFSDDKPRDREPSPGHTAATPPFRPHLLLALAHTRFPYPASAVPGLLPPPTAYALALETEVRERC